MTIKTQSGRNLVHLILTREESAGLWARRVLGDWFVCYPSRSFVFSLIVPTARIFDKSNFPPPRPPNRITGYQEIPLKSSQTPSKLHAHLSC